MLDKTVLTHLLRQMYRIRFFEERLKRHYDYQAYVTESPPAGDEGFITSDGYDFASKGLIGGAVHLSIGQEAVSAGVCAHLSSGDAAFSSHRSHGHAIAKGIPLRQVMAELMGREGGCCHGCGGSMHLFDPENGFLGGNGIVGGQLPLALGPAFAAKYRGTRSVSVAFFGDGASNQGTLLESMNLAALWKLPVLLVCENNLYANTTPAGLALPVPDVAPRARALGFPGEVVDGQDVLAVYEAAGEAVTRARDGLGPTLLEMKTYRFEGHCGIAGGHQSPEECEEWKKRDPIFLLEQRLVAEGALAPGDQEALRRKVLAEVEDAEAYAISSPLPDPRWMAELESDHA